MLVKQSMYIFTPLYGVYNMKRLLWKKDYWKDRKYLNYDMKIKFDIPKNMKYIIDLLEDLYCNNESYEEYDVWSDVLLSTAKQDLLWGK